MGLLSSFSQLSQGPTQQCHAQNCGKDSVVVVGAWRVTLPLSQLDLAPILEPSRRIPVLVT